MHGKDTVSGRWVYQRRCKGTRLLIISRSNVNKEDQARFDGAAGNRDYSGPSEHFAACQSQGHAEGNTRVGCQVFPRGEARKSFTSSEKRGSSSFIPYFRKIFINSSSSPCSRIRRRSRNRALVSARVCLYLSSIGTIGLTGYREKVQQLFRQEQLHPDARIYYNR